jgi:hypothetical protein
MPQDNTRIGIRAKTEDPDNRRIAMISREENVAIRPVAAQEGAIKFEWP